MGKRLSEEQRHEWAEKIKSQQESGLSIQKWCAENGIASHLFHYWKRRLFPKAFTRSSFVELNELKECTITIQLQSVRIQIESPSLKQAFQVLKELRC